MSLESRKANGNVWMKVIERQVLTEIFQKAIKFANSRFI